MIPVRAKDNNMALPISFVRTRDDIRIAVTEIGDGPPLLFIRGWITHLELQWAEPRFRQFIEVLAQHTRVIRFDSRGNGLSQRDVGRPQLEEFVLDVEAVMDAAGVERCAVWGSSFGGPIAIAFAARHPERVERLILEGTYPTWVDLRSTGQREAVQSLVRMLRTAPEVAGTGLSYLTDPEPETRHEDRVRRGRASIEPDYQAYLYRLRVDVRTMVSELTMPTLVMHAAGSHVWPAEGARLLCAAIPTSRYVELSGEQHNPWEGDAETALRSMCEFCDVPFTPLRRRHDNRVVVILFTDLVNSTDTASRLGDVLADDMRRAHDDIVAHAVGGNIGTLVKFTGDGALACFPTASAALAAADSISSSSQRASLQIRVGISAGEPLEEDGDLHGSAVNLAARVCAAAQPNEPLVTTAVRDLALGKGFTFEDRGTVQLKGFGEPQQLFTLSARVPRDD
jgi:class 3 adenylate cyclase